MSPFKRASLAHVAHFATDTADDYTAPDVHRFAFSDSLLGDDAADPIGDDIDLSFLIDDTY